MARGHLVGLAGLVGLAVSQAVEPNLHARNLTVDLGYGVYQGMLNASIGLQSWKGIRYAAAPAGKLRWQAPQPPPVNRTLVVADTFGPRCAQALNSGVNFPFIFPGEEDCLYVNVYTPTTTYEPASELSSDDAGQEQAAGSQNGNNGLLPVMVYIHGGGYGVGDGTLDFTTWLNSTGNNACIVAIQYRLGAFGFMSSPEIRSRGVLNAGLLDMKFALDWVQKYVSKFGGDPNQVTILGESAGGGAAMLLSIAENGSWGISRFRRAVAASPYTPTQPMWNSSEVIARYYAFSAAVGCPSSGAVFDCLANVDFDLYQSVNWNFSSNDPAIPYANWAFIPVTDYTFLTGLPSQQLAAKKVNGQAVLTSNNANEAVSFVPANITTQANVVSWLNTQFPSLTAADIAQLLAAYPTPNEQDNPNTLKFETNGLQPPTAVNISQAASGHQQQAFDMYAESTFVCPSYWLATAFVGGGRVSYRYQYSVPFAVHSIDWSSMFGPPEPMQGPDFNAAFRLMYRNFVVTGDPSIPRQIANGPSSPNPNAPNPACEWPLWAASNPMQLILNETGGTPYVSESFIGTPVIQFEEPGLMNKFTVASAYSWEGGRGQRCDVWKSIGPRVPE